MSNETQSTDERQQKAIWGLFKNYGLALSRGMSAENQAENQLAADFKQATGEDMPHPDDKRGWLKFAMAHGYPGPVPVDTYAVYEHVMLHAGRPTAPEVPALTPIEVNILKVLAKSHSTMLQVNISASLERDRKTVGLLLNKLQKAGLIHKPNGKRRGVAITPSGRAKIPR